MAIESLAGAIASGLEFAVVAAKPEVARHAVVAVPSEIEMTADEMFGAAVAIVVVRRDFEIET